MSASHPSSTLSPTPTGGWPGRVLLAGGSGAVGQQVLAQLAALEAPAGGSPQGLSSLRVSSLGVLLRRPMALPPGAQALLMQGGGQGQPLAAHPEWFQVDTVVCALGTTIRQAGSQEAFRQVDHTLVLDIARLARAQGARHFLVVSALGADPASRVFYNRVKGEMERDLAALDFDAVTVARPSLLLGERAEFRLGERLGQWASRWFAPLIPASHRPVHVAQVAAGLVAACQQPRAGLHVLDNIQLRKNPAP